ncbi:MAG TPA: 50S ribosomal protein L20 [bacterium]|nr:50S ribosomal protein L20 [bacterium]
MVRATNAPHRRRRRKKLLLRAKGFRGARKNLYRVARNAAFKARQHAYADRRRRRRILRRLWITRINAAVRPFNLPYNTFMHGLKKAGVDVNRKMLADTAVRSPDAFRSLVEVAHNALRES